MAKLLDILATLAGFAIGIFAAIMLLIGEKTEK